MNNNFSHPEPDQLQAYFDQELDQESTRFIQQHLENCQLCPRQCGINRLDGNEGFCRASSQLEIASFHPHFGEERPLVGKGGSGTIFFTNCGLRCVFCINWQISQGGEGRAQTVADLAGMMLDLEERGCHNINIVTPTHYSPHIVLALDKAAAKGLRLPMVYNTCGNGSTVVWTSSIDGQISTEGDFATNQLSEGTHHIKVAVQDTSNEGGGYGEANITLKVGPPNNMSWVLVYAQGSGSSALGPPNTPRERITR